MLGTSLLTWHSNDASFIRADCFWLHYAIALGSLRGDCDGGTSIDRSRQINPSHNGFVGYAGIERLLEPAARARDTTTGGCNG